jgi:hypothetical protein
VTQSTSSQQGVLDRDNCIIKTHHSGHGRKESGEAYNEELSPRNTPRLACLACLLTFSVRADLYEVGTPTKVAKVAQVW